MLWCPVPQLLSVLVRFVSGVHSVQVLYDDTPVPRSPFRVPVSDGCDPSKVVASGPGLQQALTDKTNKFNIVTRWSQPTSNLFNVVFLSIETSEL